MTPQEGNAEDVSSKKVTCAMNNVRPLLRGLIEQLFGPHSPVPDNRSLHIPDLGSGQPPAPTKMAQR
jgi:hypothetical protein